MSVKEWRKKLNRRLQNTGKCLSSRRAVHWNRTENQLGLVYRAREEDDLLAQTNADSSMKSVVCTMEEWTHPTKRMGAKSSLENHIAAPQAVKKRGGRNIVADHLSSLHQKQSSLVEQMVVKPSMLLEESVLPQHERWRNTALKIPPSSEAASHGTSKFFKTVLSVTSQRYAPKILPHSHTPLLSSPNIPAPSSPYNCRPLHLGTEGIWSASGPQTGVSRPSPGLEFTKQAVDFDTGFPSSAADTFRSRVPDIPEQEEIPINIKPPFPFPPSPEFKYTRRCLSEE